MNTVLHFPHEGHNEGLSISLQLGRLTESLARDCARALIMAPAHTHKHRISTELHRLHEGQNEGLTLARDCARALIMPLVNRGPRMTKPAWGPCITNLHG
jgi:hypothetical protein